MAVASKSQNKTPLSKQMMPWDVATCWNYTYKMLNFAYTYHVAYNELTNNRDMKIQKYEMEESDWEVVKQLVDVLKVSSQILKSITIVLCRSRFSKTLLYFFAFNTQPCEGGPSHGPYWSTSCHSCSRWQLQTVHSSCHCNGEETS